MNYVETQKDSENDRLSKSLQEACKFSQKLADYLQLKVEDPDTPTGEIRLIREIIIDAFLESDVNDTKKINALSKALLNIALLEESHRLKGTKMEKLNY